MLHQAAADEGRKPFFSMHCGHFFMTCGHGPYDTHVDPYEEELDLDFTGEGFLTAKSSAGVYSFGSRSTPSTPAILDAASTELPTAKRRHTRRVSFAVPNFSGLWLLDRVEGDWDAFTMEQGYGYLKRKASAALFWGVGAMTEEIKMTSSKLWLKNSTPVISTVIDVEIDNSEQDAVDPDNMPVKLKLWWEENRLECDSLNVTTGQLLARITRTMEDDIMKVVFRSSSGKEVMRYWVRQ